MRIILIFKQFCYGFVRLPRHRVEIICAIIPTKGFRWTVARDEGQASLTIYIGFTRILSKQYKDTT